MVEPSISRCALPLVVVALGLVAGCNEMPPVVPGDAAGGGAGGHAGEGPSRAPGGVEDLPPIPRCEAGVSLAGQERALELDRCLEFFVAADVDRDGIDDLLVGTHVCYTFELRDLGNTVQLLLGRGDGRFERVWEQPLSSTHFFDGRTAIVGDLEGDGAVDLLVAAESAEEAPAPAESGEAGRSHAIFVLRGIGVDGVERIDELPVSGQVHALGAGEVDGDGLQDLLVEQFVERDGRTEWVLELMRARGDGSFEPVASTSAPELRGAVGADFDGDGRLDFAVGVGDRTRIWTGRGDGSFEPSAYPLVEGYPLAAFDWNGDGATDLLVAGLALLEGRGDGTFRRVAAVERRGGFERHLGSDRADGATRLYFASSDGHAGVTVLELRGDPTAPDPAIREVHLPAPRLAHLAFARFEAEGGRPGFAFAPPGARAIGFLRVGEDGLPRGVPTSSPTPPLQESLTTLYAAGDSIADLLVGGTGATIFPGAEDGALAPPVPILAGRVLDLLALDFDGDGAQDAAALVEADEGARVVVLSAGKEETAADLDGFATQLAAGDFDGDGRPDLATNGEAGSLLLSRSHGFERREHGAVGHRIAAGDFDGDGRDDLAAVGPGVTILRNEGGGNFRPIAVDLAGAGFSPTGAIHLATARGRADRSSRLVLVRSGGLAVVSAEAGGGFRVEAQPFPVRSVSAVAASDLDGDENPDLVVVDGGALVYVAPGDRRGRFGPTSAFVVGAGPIAVAPGRFGADALPGLALLNREGRVGWLPVRCVQPEGD